MSRDYEQIPTFLGYSKEPVGVMAGGGVLGFGGIMLHEPTTTSPEVVTADPENQSSIPKGIGFAYNSVATITISGMRKWTNHILRGAPEGLQKVNSIGPIRIEIFDQEDLRQYIEQQSKLLERLGIKFIG